MGPTPGLTQILSAIPTQFEKFHALGLVWEGEIAADSRQNAEP